MANWSLTALNAATHSRWHLNTMLIHFTWKCYMAEQLGSIIQSTKSANHLMHHYNRLTPEILQFYTPWLETQSHSAQCSMCHSISYPVSWATTLENWDIHEQLGHFHTSTCLKRIGSLSWGEKNEAMIALLRFISLHKYRVWHIIITSSQTKDSYKRQPLLR